MSVNIHCDFLSWYLYYLQWVEVSSRSDGIVGLFRRGCDFLLGCLLELVGHDEDLAMLWSLMSVLAFVRGAEKTTFSHEGKQGRTATTKQ